MTTAVALESLTKTFAHRPVPAVQDVSLIVDPGELVALLGPSASGKSTVLKLIAGIEHPDQGDIKLDGQSILGVPAHRRGVVMVFQKSYLYPFMNVFDNVAFGLRVARMRKREIRAEVSRALELVELPGVERRRPNRLSGGEQQRVALARALVTRPRVLLLDEPLSSLDPTVRRALQGAIKRLQRELALTTILVTHDLGEAMGMADRVALLSEGKLVAVDEPARLFERPPNRAAALFVEVTTFFEGRLDGDQLETAFGPLVVPPQPGPPGSAVFAIRPEHIGLASQAGPNTVAGVVSQLEFRGEYTEVEVQTGTDSTVGARTLRLRQSGPCRLALGDRVYARFPPEHLYSLTD